MKKTLRTGCISLCVLAIAFLATGANGLSPTIPADQLSSNHHRSRLMAKLTMPDGATRTVQLEGVGCTQSICSRTAISARSDSDSLVRTWFDNLAAIKDTTPRDALFVMNNGTSRRMSLLTDFRVLYLASRLGGPEKLDLGAVKSVEFVTAAAQ